MHAYADFQTLLLCDNVFLTELSNRLRWEKFLRPGLDIEFHMCQIKYQ